MPTVKINITTTGAVSRHNTSFDVTAGALNQIEEEIPAGATDLAVILPLDVSQLKAFFARSAGGDLTVKTNDPTSPTNTFELTSTQPVFYPLFEGDQFVDTDDVPVVSDITSLYVTNSGLAPATFTVDVISDPTI